MIDLQKVLDKRGNLSVIEQFKDIPFKIERCYWIYDVPGGEKRGGHAYKKNEEFIVALSGSFDVVLDDGGVKETFRLDRSYYGLYIPAGVWREMVNFSTNAFALEFGSIGYDSLDYIRNYDEFLKYKNSNTISVDSKQNLSIGPEHKNSEMYDVFDCSIIEFDRHHSDRNGNLTVVENGNTLPFNVKRVYYLYDVPGGESRGSHAHKELEQLIIAASGSFTITLDDGKCKRSFFLNRPYQGLYVKPGIWRNLEDFSSGSVCMVLASDLFSEEDYIRKYDSFLEYRENK